MANIIFSRTHNGDGLQVIRYYYIFRNEPRVRIHEMELESIKLDLLLVINNLTRDKKSLMHL